MLKGWWEETKLQTSPGPHPSQALRGLSPPTRFWRRKFVLFFLSQTYASFLLYKEKKLYIYICITTCTINIYNSPLTPNIPLWWPFIGTSSPISLTHRPWQSLVCFLLLWFCLARLSYNNYIKAFLFISCLI